MHNVRRFLQESMHVLSSLIISSNWLDQIPPHRFEPSAEARTSAAAEGTTCAEVHTYRSRTYND
jgi:hypothetical protein